MATVGKVIVALIARTGLFEKNMVRAGRGVRSFGQRIARSATRVAKWGIALGIAAATGLAAIVRGQLLAIDTLAKFAARIGLSVEALQALEFAGKLSGVSMQQLGLGLQRMTRRIAEAAQGIGEAQGALKELGLDAEALAKLPVEEQFRRIADAMENVTSSSDRVRLAFKLFDSEGVALVNTLRGGSEALRAIERDARELGLTLDTIDAAQVEAANDSWQRFKTLMQGVAQVLAVQIAPFITFGVDAFVEWGKQGVGASALIAEAINLVGEGLVKMLQGINKAHSAWLNFKISLLRDRQIFQDLIQDFNKARILGDRIFALEQQLFDVFNRGLELDEDLERVRERFDEIRDAARKAAEEAKKIVPPDLIPLVEPEPDRPGGETVDRAGRIRELSEDRLRQGAFGEADLRTIAFNRPLDSATERSRALTNEILERIRKLLEDPKPVPIIWRE